MDNKFEELEYTDSYETSIDEDFSDEPNNQDIKSLNNSESNLSESSAVCKNQILNFYQKNKNCEKFKEAHRKTQKNYIESIKDSKIYKEENNIRSLAYYYKNKEKVSENKIDRYLLKKYLKNTKSQ
tara:strand:+ start:299 stop:676 length:378 start_codon:yes stop_codon:yes gene_type:complete